MVSSEICTKVYVGGIPYYSTEDDIRSYFESCGTVTEIDCMSFPESGKFRGIAIIGFKVSFFVSCIIPNPLEMVVSCPMVLLSKKIYEIRI